MTRSEISKNIIMTLTEIAWKVEENIPESYY